MESKERAGEFAEVHSARILLISQSVNAKQETERETKMKNTVTTLIETSCRKAPTTRPALDEQSSYDFGCIKPDYEFNARAADVIAGADAEQFETLVEAVALSAFNSAKNVEDEAYARAGELILKAVEELRKRSGN